MSSSSTPLLSAPPLAQSRYSRQLLVPGLRGLSGQTNLLNSRVLIIGLGGLGCPAALYLSGAGIGTLGLMDADTVEVSNLHRQIAHSEHAAREGWSKVRSVLDRCRSANSDVQYVGYETRASAGGGEGGGGGEGTDPGGLLEILIQGRWQVVLDCTDNPATRYLISDCCAALGLVLVSGAAQRGEGQLVVLNCPPVAEVETVTETNGYADDKAVVTKQKKVIKDKGPCYRCVFPRPPPPEMVRGCGEIGILGHVVGTIGTLMAGEVVKIVSQGRHLPRHSGFASTGTEGTAETVSEKTAPGQGDGAISSNSVNGVASQSLDPNTHASTQPQPQPQPQGQPDASNAQATSPPTINPPSSTPSKPTSKPTPSHTMLLYNTFASDPRQQFRTITLRGRRPDCVACGDDDVLASKGLERITRDTIAKGRLDYVAFCGVEKEVRLLTEENRVDARVFLDRLRGAGNDNSTNDNIPNNTVDTDNTLWQQHRDNATSNGMQHQTIPTPNPTSSPTPSSPPIIVVDVREEHEVELGAKVRGSVNIPISKILRSGGKAFDVLKEHLLSHSHSYSAKDVVTGPGPGPNTSTGRDTDTDTDADRLLEAKGSLLGEGKLGGTINDETHIDTNTDAESNQPSNPSADSSTSVYEGGGMLNNETHIPSSPTSTPNPTSALPAVVFVCQRGNDSQIAAQRLLDHVLADEDASLSGSSGLGLGLGSGRGRGWGWGWIGDVRGGFVAMERYEFGR